MRANWSGGSMLRVALGVLLWAMLPASPLAAYPRTQARPRLGDSVCGNWDLPSSSQAAFRDRMGTLRAAARAGDAGAQLCLASRDYGDGRYAKALRWLIPAARAGNALAQFNVGVFHDRGLGVGRDPAAAALWYRRSALQGLAYAQFNLAVLYANGIGVARSAKAAMFWYRRAARQGLARAEFNLGVMYHRGEGVERDDARAARWWRRAARRGMAPAQFDLGLLYQLGLGVRRDVVRARYWYEAAATQGLAVAQNNLGLLYQAGRGVTRNPGRAIHWLRLAAEQGDWGAQYNLGVQCVKAPVDGCSRSSGMAWLMVACLRGGHTSASRLACRARHALASELTAQDMRAARHRAARWMAVQEAVAGGG